MGQETGCLGARRGSLLSRRVSPKLAHNLRPRSPTHLGRQCQDFEVVWKPGMQAILSHSREAVTMGATFWIELGAFRAAQAHIWSPRHPFPGPEHLSEMPESPDCRHLSCTCKDAWIQACTHTNSGSTSACRVWHFAVVNQTLNPFITINLQTCRAWNWHQLVPHHEVWESLFQRCHNLLVACKRAFQPANTVLSRSRSTFFGVKEDFARVNFMHQLPHACHTNIDLLRHVGFGILLPCTLDPYIL